MTDDTNEFEAGKTIKSSSEDLVTHAKSYIGDAEGSKPPGISEAMWQKFQKLHAKREEIVAKSKLRQHREFQKQIKREAQNYGKEQDNAPSSSKQRRKEDSGVMEQRWSDIKPFMHCKDNLKGVDKGKHEAKTGLDKAIDTAISQGDYQQAEKLSDHKADREFGLKITEAIEAKEFAKQKEKDAVRKREKETRKLKWGFTHKERWESKSNM